MHGLCMNDLQWHTEREGTVVDHGDALASALGYTPVYVLYNSGLHTSQNGHELSAQLEALVAHWPVPIDDLTVVAHSMGGLLIRSAHHYASREARNWPGVLRHIVFLGTPHHGAPLERAGHHFHNILDTTPVHGTVRRARPLAKCGHHRSALRSRRGRGLESGTIAFTAGPTRDGSCHLPQGVKCFAVAATTPRGAARSPTG